MAVWTVKITIITEKRQKYFKTKHKFIFNFLQIVNQKVRNYHVIRSYFTSPSSYQPVKKTSGIT